MIIWLLWFSAFAWTTSKCEPPVNSYLPPENDFGSRPSQEYGPPAENNPGREPNSRQTGNRNQPQDSYSLPNQRSGSPDPQYGPPGRRGAGFGSTPSQRPNQSFGAVNSPRQDYGIPSAQNNAEFRNAVPFGGASNAHDRTGGRDRSVTNHKPDTFYGPPSNQGRGPSGGNTAQDRSNINQRPDTSYGPPSGSGNFPRRNGPSRPGDFGETEHPQSSYGPPPVGSPQGGSTFGQGQRGQNSLQKGLGNSSPNLNENLLNLQQLSSSYGSPEFGGSSGRLRDIVSGESDEPAKYEFNYDVDDTQTGTIFGHSEKRDGDTAMGMYNVVLPDGRKQVVEYEAGRQGYKPQIRYEGGNNGGGSSAMGPGRRGESSQGYPRGRPNDNQRNEADDYNGNAENAPYLQQASLDGQSGYPRGGSGGFGENGLNSESNGYSRQQNVQSGGFGNNHGPNASGRESGYPKGGPQNGKRFSTEDSPSSSSDYTGSPPHQGPGLQGSRNGDGGYPRGKAQGGSGNFGNRSLQQENDFNSLGNEGYPRGSPGDQGRGAVSRANRPQGERAGFDNDSGYPSGEPDGPRGSGY